MQNRAPDYKGMNRLDSDLFIRSKKQARYTIASLSAVIMFGTIGYMLIEDYTFTQAMFMTIITIATVGFGYIRDLSTEGMWFSVILIVSSIGIFAYAISSLTKYIVNGVLTQQIKLKNMKKRIDKQKGHIIVVGYGRNGSQAIKDLREHNIETIIIDKNPDIIDKISATPDQLYIEGDATNDEILYLARIHYAKALITALPNDADNLFVVLTARDMNNDLKIISRASNFTTIKKLKAAGATNVIMPDKIGGQHMAKLVAQPDVVEFMEYILLSSNHAVHLEEVSCEDLATCFSDKSISELGIRNMSGANIIGLKKDDGSYVFNPGADTILSKKDQVFVLGSPDQIRRLKQIISDGN
ncbi:MAG: potassium channel protein [Bacteroidales bacterium]|jgi:voltage-gated potassium channel|nr:potassium channel protein [Bacteroidales bacterium]